MGNYICDDGNNVNGDGCSSDCMTVETGWHCSNRAMYYFHSGGLYLPCHPICGDAYHPNINVANADAFLQRGRTTNDNANGDFCDDGLYIQFDGCDRNCEKDFTDFICVDGALPNINTVCTE